MQTRLSLKTPRYGWWILALVGLVGCGPDFADPAAPTPEHASGASDEAPSDAEAPLELDPTSGPRTKVDWSSSLNVGEIIDKVRHAVRPDPGRPELWRVRDATYLAQHQGARFSFTPHHGRSGEPERPDAAVTWQTVSVAVGPTALASGAPARSHHENRVDLRWSSVREFYIHRDTSVEQAWEITALPKARTGDLVIKGQVQNAAFVEATRKGLHFAPKGTDLQVAYSPATVYDAAGRKLTVQPAWDADANQVHITVPEAWLAEAVLPVVVDPTFTSEAGTDNPVTPAINSDEVFTDVGPSVAFDGTNFIVVWVEDKGDEGDGVYATIVNNAGTLLTPTGFAVSVAGALDWQQPRVTSDGGNWYVVWADQRTDGANPFVLRGSLINDTTLTNIQLTEVTVADGTTPANLSGARVASDGNGFFVVFEADNGGSGRDVYYRRVTAAGALVEANPTLLTNASGDQVNPDVSGDAGRYMIVWDDNGATTPGIRADTFQGGAFDGRLTISNTNSPATPSVSCDQVTVGANNRWYCTVAWTVDGGANGDDVRLQNARIESATNPPTLDGSTLTVNVGTDDQNNPQVSRRGEYIILAYAQPTNGGDVGVASISSNGSNNQLGAVDATATVAGSADAEVFPAIAAGNYDGAASKLISLIAWNNTTDRNIEANILEDEGGTGAFVASVKANTQTRATVAASASRYLVAWVDERNGFDDIYAARIDPDGTILDTAGLELSNGAEVDGLPTACDVNGTTVVAWVEDGVQVKASRVTLSNGTVNGPDDLAGALTGGDTATDLDCASNGTDALVVWLNQDSTVAANNQVTTVRFSTAGAASNLNNDITGASAPSSIAVASDGTDYLVAWTGTGGANAYTQRIAADGTTSGSNVQSVTATGLGAIDLAFAGDATWAAAFTSTSGGDAEIRLAAIDDADLSAAVSSLTANALEDLSPTLAVIDTDHVAAFWQRIEASGNSRIQGIEAFVAPGAVTPFAAEFTARDSAFNDLAPSASGASNGKALVAYQSYVPNSGTVRVRDRVGTFNRRPAVTNDTYPAVEDTTLSRDAAAGVLANDSDPDGNPMTVTVVDDVDNGTLNLSANGSFTYTPNADFSGTDSFTYTASDGTLTSKTATVTLNVAVVDDPPVAVADAYSVNEDNVLNINAAAGVLANDTDNDSPSLTANLVDDVDNGTLDLNPDGSFEYTPDTNFNGTDTFTYTANDGTSPSNTVTVTLTVNPVNDPPVAVNDPSYTTNEDDPLVRNAADGVLANDTDVEGNPLTAVLVTNVSNGALTLNANGSFTYTPNANFNGTDSFTYRANDGTVNSQNIATVTINVASVNDPPVANADSYNAVEEQLLSVPAASGVLINDSDVETPTLTVSLVDNVDNGNLTLNANGSFTYTGNANFFGTDSFTYRASDGTAFSNTVIVNINVSNVQDPPVATDDTYSTNEDVALTRGAAGGVLANDGDPDGDTLTASVVTTVTNGTLSLNPDGGFTYTPNTDFNGTDSFTYRASDGQGNNDNATVTITVNNAQDAPTVTIDQDTYTVNEGASISVSATGSDPDEPAANLTYSWDLNGDGNFGDATGDTVTFNAADGPQSVAISVRVTDSDGTSATDNATVNIANVAPIITTAASQAPPLNESASISFTGAATDPGNDTLTFTWDFGEDGAAPGSGQNPTHTYQDDGQYTVTLTVTDSDGASSSQSFSVTILNVIPTLAAITGPVSVNEGSSNAWASVLSKASNDDVIVSASWGDGTPSNTVNRTGTATSINNSFNHTYTDNLAGNAPYTITFNASDDDASNATPRTLSVIVNNVAPTINNITNDNNLNEGATFNFTASVSDPGNDSLNVRWEFTDSTLEGNSISRSFPDNGVYPVTVTVTDDDGASDTETFNVTVTNANPTIGTFTLPASGNEGQQLAFVSAATDPAGANDPLVYTWNFGDGSDPVVGQNPNHTYTQNGTYTVTLTVTDDDGGSRQRQGTITINNVPPTFGATTIPTTGNEGQQLSFSAAATDPGNDTLTFTWVWGDGTPNTTGRNVTHTFADDTDGPYTVRLTVTDQDGASPAPITRVITINNVNPTITGITGQFSGAEGQQLSYTAAVTDPAGANDTLTYTWNFGDGSAQISGVDRTNVNHTYAQNGTYTLRLTVTDEDGGTTTTTRTVNVGGEGPTITSLTGDANGVEGDTFDFVGAATEPGGLDPITYSWHFGDPAAAGDPCAAPDEEGVDLTDVSHTYADDGQYVVTLCAADDDGSVSQTFNVTVTNANPTLNTTLPSNVREAQSRPYTATTSDPGDDTVTVTWSWGDGSDDTVGDSVSHTYPDNGTYELTVTATDEDGGVTVQTANISVSNRPPSIDSMTVPAASAEAVPVNFTASASDPAGDNDPLTYTWNPGDGTPLRNGTNVTHTYADNGTYTVTLTVSDGDGGSVSDTRTINVSNTPPEITTFQGTQLGDEAGTYSYTVVASDSAGGGDPLTYTWNFGDGSPVRSGGNLDTINHIYADNGSYTVTLTVDDGDGGVVTRTLPVTVRNVAPTIQGIITGTASGNEGGFFAFNAVATDPGADTLTYTWELADGSSDIVGVDRTDISHVFRNNPLGGNRYTVRLTVTDDDDATDTETFDVTVNNVAPVIRVGASQSGPEGSSLTFRANSSDPGVFNDTDPDNPPSPDRLTYTWDFGDGSNPAQGVGLNEVPHTYRDNGVYTVTVTVTDSDGASDEGTIPATVGNVAPIITSSPPIFGAEGQPYTYMVTLVDPANTPDTSPTGDNDPITYRLLQSPQGMSVSPDGVITWTPTNEQATTEPPVFAVTLRVEDGDGGIATQRWNINLDFQDRDGDGSPDECEDADRDRDGFPELNGDSNCDGDLGADACGDNFFPDYDGDGISNTRECLQGSDPTVSDAPGAPSISSPLIGEVVAGPIIILAVNNAFDPNGDLLEYTFELYSAATLEPETLVEGVSNIRQQTNVTSYIVSTPIEAFEENAFYWWRAKANDLFGEGPWSDVGTFQFSAVNDSPSVPVPMTPNLETNARSQASFVFTNATDPESDPITYEIEIYLNNADQPLVLNSGTIPSDDGDQTVWTMPFNEEPLADDTPHLWRIRAIDSNGATSDWSELIPFVVSNTNEPPTVPTLMYPEDNQMLASMEEFFFLFGASTDDDNRDTDLRYTVVVSRERGCPGLLDDAITDADAAAEGLIAALDGDGNPVEVAATLDDFANTDAIFDAGTGALTENRTYHWCVFAFDGSTRSAVATSTFRYSTSNAAPSKVVLTSPIGNAVVGELAPDLVWRNAQDEEGDAIVYNVQVATDADFTQVLFDANFAGDAGASTTLQSPGLTEDTSYWWRVRASDPTDDGEWSDPGAFRVNLTRQLPSAPVLLAPENNTTVEEPRPVDGAVDPALNFAWENATDPEGTALEYELWILPSNAALDRVFATEPLVVEGQGGTTGFDTTLSALNLSPDRYSWIVRAIKTIETPDGTAQLVGPWSNARSFSVQGLEPLAEEIPVPEPEAPEYPPATETCECSSVGGATSTPSAPLGLALVALGFGFVAARRRRSSRR